jgi:hypothetical protein
MSITFQEERGVTTPRVAATMISRIARKSKLNGHVARFQDGVAGLDSVCGN